MTTAREQLTFLLEQMIENTNHIYPQRNEMARMFAPDLVDNMLQETRLSPLVRADDFRDAVDVEDDQNPEDLLLDSVDQMICRLEGWDHAWIATMCVPVAYPGVEYAPMQTSRPFRSAAEAATWAVDQIRGAHKTNPDVFYKLTHTDEDAELFEIMLDSRNAQVN